MKHCTTALAFALVVCLGTSADATLITNGSFESVPSSATGSGLIPTGWFHTNPASPAGSRADTFSNDGSYGLAPGATIFDSFIGASAHDGIRWVAGVSASSHSATNMTVAGEAFGTALTQTLIAGESYQLDAFLYRNTDVNIQSFDKPGGYQLFLSGTTNGTGAVLLGALGMVTTNSWQARSLTFSAPSDAASRPYLIFVPYWVSNPFGSGFANSYIGIDDVSLVSLSTPVPAPAGLILALSGLATLTLHKGRHWMRTGASAVEC